jgi:hypothetical protein
VWGEDEEPWSLWFLLVRMEKKEERFVEMKEREGEGGSQCRSIKQLHQFVGGQLPGWENDGHPKDERMMRMGVVIQ